VSEPPLDLDVRRRIYGRIREDPGLHLRELSRALDVPLSTLRHHLGVLEEADVVTVEREGTFKRYFPAEDLSEGDKSLLSVLRREKPRAILLDLLAHGGEARYGELEDSLGYPSSTLGMYLKELRERGLVDRQPVGRTSVYRVVDERRLHRLLVTYEESFYDAWVDRVLEIVEEINSKEEEPDDE
jgi:predicted transcriptional regulator